MRVQLAQQAQDSWGKAISSSSRSGSTMWPCSSGRWSRWAWRCSTGISRHWKQRGLSWGWTGVIWLAYILTEGDHRKASVEAYIKGMHHTLSQLTGQRIEPLDFSDDRLGHL